MAALIVVFLFRMIIAFKVFDLVFMLTMGGPGNSTQVASFYIYKVGFKMFNTGYGAALSLLVLLGVVTAVTWIATLLCVLCARCG